MEDMLIVWIQNMIYKKIPVSSKMVCEQSLQFYAYVAKKYEIMTAKTEDATSEKVIIMIRFTK